MRAPLLPAGNAQEDLKVLGDRGRRLPLIMKDGKIKITACMHKL